MINFDDANIAYVLSVYALLAVFLLGFGAHGLSSWLKIRK